MQVASTTSGLNGQNDFSTSAARNGNSANLSLDFTNLGGWNSGRKMVKNGEAVGQGMISGAELEKVTDGLMEKEEDKIVGELEMNSNSLNRKRSGSITSIHSSCSDLSAASSFWSSSDSRTSTPCTPPTPLISPHGTNSESCQSYFTPRGGGLLPIQEESSSSSSNGAQGGQQGINGSTSSLSSNLNRKPTSPPQTPTQRSSQFSHGQVSSLSSCMKGTTSPTSRRGRSASQSSHRSQGSVVSFDMVGGGSLSVYQELQNQSRDGEVGNIMKSFKSALLKKVKASRKIGGGGEGVEEVEPQSVKGSSSSEGKKKKEFVISAPTLISSTYSTDPKRSFDWNKTFQLDLSSPNVQHIGSSSTTPVSSSSSSPSSSPLEVHQDNISNPNKLLLEAKFNESSNETVNVNTKTGPVDLDSNAIERLVIANQTSVVPPLLLHQRRSSSFGPRTSSLNASQLQFSGSVSTLTSLSTQLPSEASKDSDEKELKAMKRRGVRIISKSLNPVMHLDDDRSLMFQFSLSLSYQTETISALTSDSTST